MDFPTDTSPFHQRREPRYRVSWRGQLLAPGGAPVEIRVKDISPGGVGILAEQSFPIGTMVSVTLRIPDPTGGCQVLDASGQARTAFSTLIGRDFRVGLLWIEPSADVTNLIDLWVRKLRDSA